MLNNLILTINIVMPFLIYLILGAAFKKLGIMSEDFARDLNKFVGRILMPANLFNNMIKADISAIGGSFASIYILITLAIQMAFLILFVPMIEKDPLKQGSLIQGGYRGNLSLFAIPLSAAILGSDNAGLVTILLVGTILVYNIVSIPLLSVYVNKANGTSTKADFGGSLKKILIDCVKSPMLDAVLIALVINLMGMKLPSAASSVINSLASAAVPISFIVLGARLNPDHLKMNSKSILVLSFLKLFAFSAVFLIYPIMAGWTPQEILAVYFAFGAPTAVTSYAVATSCGCDSELAGEMVTITTVFSMVSCFLWIFFLKQAAIV